MSDLVDGTKDLGKTFNQSGLITWTPLAENVEFRTTIGRKEQLFYYKLTTTVALVRTRGNALSINGIPAQKPISNYKFALNAQGRTWLFNDQANESNKSIVSNVATLNVFNGEELRRSVLLW